MAEEQENGGGTSLKSILIGLVSTITIAVGGFITNKLTGEGGNEPAPVQQAAPVINITNSNQQQQSAGKTVIIKEKAAPASASSNQAKPVEKAKPKEKEDEEW
jgi:hypothetical protein